MTGAEVMPGIRDGAPLAEGGAEAIRRAELVDYDLHHVTDRAGRDRIQLDGFVRPAATTGFKSLFRGIALVDRDGEFVTFERERYVWLTGDEEEIARYYGQEGKDAVILRLPAVNLFDHLGCWFPIAVTLDWYKPHLGRYPMLVRDKYVVGDLGRIGGRLNSILVESSLPFDLFAEMPIRSPQPEDAA